MLCTVTFALSLVLVALNGFRGLWYAYTFRFLILFSCIVPIRSASNSSPPTCDSFLLAVFPNSLQVNLDTGKTRVYTPQITNGPEISGTIVRTSTLLDELGKAESLPGDKTRTLAQNGPPLLFPLTGPHPYDEWCFCGTEMDTRNHIWAPFRMGFSGVSSATRRTRFWGR